MVTPEETALVGSVLLIELFCSSLFCVRAVIGLFLVWIFFCPPNFLI